MLLLSVFTFQLYQLFVVTALPWNEIQVKSHANSLITNFQGANPEIIANAMMDRTLSMPELPSARGALHEMPKAPEKPSPPEGMPNPHEGMPKPSEAMPKPPETPNAPEGMPKPPEGMPNAPEGMPKPPEGMPNAPEGMPKPPEGMPNAPEGMPKPPEGMPNPPEGMPNAPHGEKKEFKPQVEPY